MKKIVWGEKRYYSSLKDDTFMHTKVKKQTQITANYRYLPRSFFVRAMRFLFYYLIALPVCWIITKFKCGVKVKGKKNLRKIKGGALLIGNHCNTLDPMLATVNVAAPKRNYFVANKDAVQVVVGKYFTKALGALPLPDETRGLRNLSNAVVTLLKRGNTVTIYPEAAIWPYSTKLRPFTPASFHYAIKADVPVVPFAVTYRYAKHRPLKKKPKVNITILEPIYANKELDIVRQKKDLCERTEKAIKEVVESKDNVTFIEYLPM